MVAAQRVLSHREGLIDDPFAEPLVRAVGLDFFMRILDGEVDPSSRSIRGSTCNARPREWPSAHVFDRLFTDAAATGVRQAVILAAGPGRAGLPVAVA